MSLPIVFRVEAQAEFNRAFDWYEQQQRGPLDPTPPS